MTWWAWVLVWALLLVGSAAVMFLLARSLWHKAAALFTELGRAADRLSILDSELATLADRTDAVAEELAVFADPVELRQAQAKARSARNRPGRQPRHRAVTIRPTEPGRATLR